MYLEDVIIIRKCQWIIPKLADGKLPAKITPAANPRLSTNHSVIKDMQGAYIKANDGVASMCQLNIQKLDLQPPMA